MVQPYERSLDVIAMASRSAAYAWPECGGSDWENPSPSTGGGVSLGWTRGEDSVWRRGEQSLRKEINMVAEPGSPGQGRGWNWTGKGPGPSGFPGSVSDQDTVWICGVGDGQTEEDDSGQTEGEEHVRVRVPSDGVQETGGQETGEREGYTEEPRDYPAFGAAEREQFRLFQKWMRTMGEIGQGEGASGGRGDRQHVHLDEKYFRRVDKFDGDPNKYRGWIFELVVALGQVDGDLQKVIEKLVMGKEDVVGKGSVGGHEARMGGPFF